MFFPTSEVSSKTSRYRFLRAYGVTFTILAHYLFVIIIQKFIPSKQAEKIWLKTHQRASLIIICNILKLKGLYIKIGQTLSVMSNFLPPSFTEGLEKLQDAVPPHPYREVVARFLTDFQKTPEEMFARFEETPIASASLGQVHVAYLPNGTKVAVKLQYPQIDTIVKKDLKALKRIFGLLDFLFPIYHFKNIYNECSQVVLEELNYIYEGKNLERIRDNFIGNPQTVFPKVYWDFSSPKILTLEFIEGIKVNRLDLLKEAQIKAHDVAVSLIHSYCKQIFIDGVYHADPHPGNIIIIPSKTPETSFQIALVDFGATATIPDEMKKGLTLFVEGLLKKDTQLISNSLKQMGFIAREDNEEAINKIVDYFYGKIKTVKIEDFRSINLSDFHGLNDIFELKKVDISLKELSTTFHIPKDWILLERALILAMGLVSYLDPQLNPMDIVLPYVEQFVVGKDKKITDMLLMAGKDLLTSYINLPSEIHRVLRKMEQGKISFTDKTRIEATERTYRGIHQLIYTQLLICSIILYYLSQKQGNLEWVSLMKYASFFFGILLMISFFKNRK